MFSGGVYEILFVVTQYTHIKQSGRFLETRMIENKKSVEEKRPSTGFATHSIDEHHDQRYYNVL